MVLGKEVLMYLLEIHHLLLVMDMEATPYIFEAGMVGVTNGPQLSDGQGNAQALMLQ